MLKFSKLPLATALSLIVLLVAIQPGFAGPAIQQFELKDLEAEPGSIEFQSQNAHFWGQPRRKFAADDDDPNELLFDGNSVIHQSHALEVEVGITNYLRVRVGVEYEKERLDDPAFLAAANDFNELKFEEIGGELVVILSPVPEQGGIGFGLLVEVEHVIEAGELNAFVVGPIIEGKSGPWSFIANLGIVKFYGDGEISEEGELERDDKIDFVYAAQVAYQATDQLALTLEAYGTIDRLGNTGRPSEEARVFGDHNLHRLGPIVYYSFKPGSPTGFTQSASLSENDENELEATLGMGLLFGLNDNTADVAAKWSLEFEF